MTTSTTSLKLDKLNQEIYSLTRCYKQDQTAKYLKLLIEKTFEFCSLLRKYEFNHNNRVLEDFDEDVCLEYLGMVLSERQITDPRHKIRGIISKRIYQHNVSSTYNIDGMEFFSDCSTINYLDTKLFLNDVLTLELEGIEQRLKILIVYYLINFKLIKNFIILYPNVIEKFIIVLKVYQIRKKMINESERTFEISFSKDRITNLLMLSGLFNESPEMFVLLTLLGDFKKFLTYISLFEGKTVYVPKINEINKIFNKSASVANSFEAKDMSVKQKENLLSLVTNVKLEDVTSETRLTPFLETYIQELVKTSMDNYSKTQEKHLKSVDFSDVKKVKDAYLIVNEEMSSVSKLLEELFSTLSTSKDIKYVVEQIKTTKTNQN